jgi:dTDP-4-dehydrorhamnose reductase
MTRWLVTGARGMLGRDLLAALSGREVLATDLPELDITDAAAVAAALDGVDVVINAAAWTDVDGAESHAAAAMTANGQGPRVLAQACRASGARLVHVSTDYVFAGAIADSADPATAAPYREGDPTGPRTEYGRSKLAGELAILEELPDQGFIARTAWLYGEHGRNFVRTMLMLERTKPELDVVDDQWGQPTWTSDLATRLVALGEADAEPGIYHLTGSGRTTWCGLAKAVFAGIGADPARVRPTTTDKFPRPAPRPAFSVLGSERAAAAGIEPMPAWETSLAQALPRLVRLEEGSGT